MQQIAHLTFKNFSALNLEIEALEMEEFAGKF
jgi:hypothetical protein